MGALLTRVRKVLPPTPAALPSPGPTSLTLDGAEAPALVLAVVLGGGAPQVPILAARAGAAVEPLVVILEGDGARLPVGVALDGVDLCRRGEPGPWHLGPRGCPACSSLRGSPLQPRELGWGRVSREREGAAMPDGGRKAASALGSAQEPARGPAAHPIGLGRGVP